MDLIIAARVLNKRSCLTLVGVGVLRPFISFVNFASVADVLKP